MPYVPREDRPVIDAAVEKAAVNLVSKITTNFSVLRLYKDLFTHIGTQLGVATGGGAITGLADTIFGVAVKYGYEGAFLGELNYAITRLIQRVPQLMVAAGKWQAKDELRYWLYACTVEALIYAANTFKSNGCGIGGVFEDIKDEYKRRVNTAYEGAQIDKSGDCYDTPYYNRQMRLVDNQGNTVGKILVDMPRSDKTLNIDELDFTIQVTP